MRLPVRLPVRARSRILLAAIVVVLVAVASTGAWLLIRDPSAAAPTTTATVSSQTVQQTVSAEGTVAARNSADESFTVSGTVTRVLVSEGDRVHRGDALARVDDASLVATRTAAVSSLDAAVEQLDSDEDAGASDVQLASDQAAVVSARATLDDARAAVRQATLRASITGTVTAVGIGKGDTVGSSAPSGSGGAGASSGTDSTSTSSDATISIVSTGSFVVDATVAASDVKQVKTGLQAQITATGVQDTIYGTVSSVGLVAQTNDSGAAVFPVKIAVTGKVNDLYAGVSATASIIVQQRPDVLTVTSRALTTTDGKTYVTKLVGGKKVRTPVEIGETYGLTTEVVSGLKAGDQVVVAGFAGPGGTRSRTGQVGQGGQGGPPEGFPSGGFPGGFSGGGPAQ